MRPHEHAARRQGWRKRRSESSEKNACIFSFDERGSCPQSGPLYMIEVNPRASRTVPVVSKTVAVSQARMFTFSFDERTVSMRSMPVHRRASGKLRKPLHAGRNPRRNRLHRRSPCSVREREGSRVPLREVPGR